MTLSEVVKHTKPTILLGLSGTPNIFTEDIIREMTKFNERPIIFPLSNPTHRAECSFEQAVNWTDGKVIFASGSPFEPYEYKGVIHYPSQGNNMFIYPAIGLAAVVSKSSRISISMFSKAAEALSEYVPQSQLEKGNIYPDVKDIRKVTLYIAMKVYQVALEQGISKHYPPTGVTLHDYIASHMYIPSYNPYVKQQ